MTSFTILLPIPPKELSPNARVHWSKVLGVKRDTKAAAYYECIKVMGGLREWKSAEIDILVVGPNALRCDPDNLLARMKWSLDGIAHAIGCNDKDFAFLPIRRQKSGHRKSVKRPIPDPTTMQITVTRTDA